ncbi:MAG TPA: BatA domain-containing protein [Gemmatimonadaceae bacterium]|nr:BatA domain-containing protein [Gemmatimonadaceae bacterium]
MTLLAPLWLGVGIAAALGVLALHLIARMRPAPMLLPTARFVPDLPARAASRAPRPTDVPLLLLRAAAAILLGLAFAGPLVTSSRTPLARVVMLDRSGAVADPESAATLAASLLREGDVLVAFDTVAQAVAWRADAVVPDARQAPGDLAAALVVAIATARDLAPRADSVELVLVSPVDQAAWSAAVLPVRAEWTGGIRLERVAAAVVDSAVLQIFVDGAADDPLRATVALLGAAGPASSGVWVSRDSATGADSARVSESGGVLVVWPRDAAADSSGSGAGAVIAGDVVAVAPWTRAALPAGRAIARWVDGGPAATEAALGRGCVRHVGIGIPEAGDAALAPATLRLVRALAAACGDPGRTAPVHDSLVRHLVGAGGAVPGRRLVRAGPATSPATPWLLAAGIVLLLVEIVVRDRRLAP